MNTLIVIQLRLSEFPLPFIFIIYKYKLNTYQKYLKLSITHPFISIQQILIIIIIKYMNLFRKSYFFFIHFGPHPVVLRSCFSQVKPIGLVPIVLGIPRGLGFEPLSLAYTMHSTPLSYCSSLFYLFFYINNMVTCPKTQN